MTLATIRPGQTGRIARVGGTGALRRRLLDMGVVRGAEAVVIHVAPLGGPLEIAIKQYRLTLRRAEAEAIDMEDLRS